MQELRTSTKVDTQELIGKTVTIFFEPYFITLIGRWHWDFISDSVFCSNVMLSLHQDFDATRGMIHPDDVEKVKAKLESDTIRHLEFRIITSYGEVKTIAGENLTIHSRIEFFDEAIKQVRELSQNAIDKKELQQLQLFKEVHEKADRLTNSGIWWHNAATSETWYSAEVFRIYELAPFSVNSHLNTFLPFIHEEDRQLVQEYLSLSYKHQTPLHIQYRIQTGTGEKYLQHISQWIYSANGEPVLSGMFKEITEEKKKEIQLDESEQQVNFLKQQLQFDEQNNATAHWYVNLITRKYVYSPNYYRLFGLRGKTVIEPSAFNDYIHPEDREAYRLATQKMLHQHAPPEIDFRIYRGDGKLRYFSQKAKLVADGNDMMMMGTIEDVTVKTLLQNKIKEFNDAQTVRSFAYQQVQEMTRTAGWVWNTIDSSIQWSENFYNFLGVKPGSKELTQKLFLGFVHPEDQELFRDQMNLLLLQKQEAVFNFRLQLFGKTKYVTAAFRLMKHEEEELFIATFKDITNEHLLTEELNQRIQLAEALSQNTLDRIIITDVHHTIKIWNKACEEIYRMGINEVLGKNFFDVFPKKKTEEEITLFNRVLKGERIFIKAHRSLTVHGYYDLHLLPAWDSEHNEVSGIIHIMHDVTQEMKLQQNLGERLRFIESLVESSPDRIIAIDRNLNYLVWNKKAEEYYGLRKEHVVNKNVLEVFPHAQNTPTYEQLRKALRGETVSLSFGGEDVLFKTILIPIKNEKQEVVALLWIEHDLSKEIESERRLREQTELLETVFDASMDGIILLKAIRNNDGIITDYEVLMNNAVTQKWNGRSLVGKNYVEEFPSVKEKGLIDAYNKVMETGEPLDTEIFYEGEQFKNWFRVTAVKLSDDELVATAEDITERKLAVEKLKESQHWLEQTAIASPDSISVYDLQKKQPLYLNNCLSEWVGMSSGELTDLGIEGRLKLVHPDDRLKLLHFNGKLAEAKDGDVITLEYRMQTQDDQTIWLRNRSKVFQRDEAGNATHVLTVLQNVTEEIALRNELKQRSQFAEFIMDNSTDRITVFDRNYRFIVWNKRCEEIHGITKGKVIGKTIFEMFPGVENAPAFMNAQERSLAGEYVHVPPLQDGYTGAYLELFYVPLKNDSGETYAVLNIMHDVSRYVRNSEELDALNKKLAAKNRELEQKNEEITGFAFVASHDMKEPLRKIHTFADWLVETEKEWLSDAGKTILEKINDSVKRMEQLIDDILVLTKIHSDTQREEDVDLNDVLRRVKDEMKEKIQKTDTIIETQILPVIKGNHHQLFYLFENLVSNAIKFQKPGSIPHITITSEIVKGSEVPINEPREEYLKLSFADNGFGFDQRYAKKIFQVFQRLHGKHEFEGTGIGLAICRKIMENHNGLINVISKVGKGSVFNCFFPLH